MEAFPLALFAAVLIGILLIYGSQGRGPKAK